MQTNRDNVKSYYDMINDTDDRPSFFKHFGTHYPTARKSWDPWFPEADEITLSGMIKYRYLPEIKDVIFNDPATIVYWKDGTKTIVKCQKETGDSFSKETGLVMAIAKKALGNKGNFNDILKKWIKD